MAAAATAAATASGNDTPRRRSPARGEYEVADEEDAARPLEALERLLLPPLPSLFDMFLAVKRSTCLPARSDPDNDGRNARESTVWSLLE
eukprot:2465971-Prymnesium_polylepis.1